MVDVSLLMGAGALAAVAAYTQSLVRTRWGWGRLRRWARAREMSVEHKAIVGMLGRRRVELWRVGHSIRARNIVVKVMLQPPLGMGLLITPKQQPARTHLSLVQTPGPPLYAYVYGHERSRCQALLDSSNVLMERLCRFHRGPLAQRPILTDESISFLRPVSIAPERLEQDMQQAVALCDAIDEQRQELPPAAGLEHVAERWRVMAARHDLAFSCAPLSVSGSFEGQRVWAVAVPEPPVAGNRHYTLDVMAWFSHPLPLGSKLSSRAGEPLDGAFHRAFVWEPASLEELLDTELCETLMQQRAHAARVSVDRTSLWLRLAETSASIEEVLARMADVAWLAREITLRARGGRRPGQAPYR